MVVSTQIEPFFRWLLIDAGAGRSALLSFVFTALTLLVIVLAVAYLVAAFRHGPIRGGKIVLRSLGAGLVDIVRMSPRRIYGLSTLAFREAFRRHIWVSLVIFLIVLGFTGWFLDPKSDDPAKLSLTFMVMPTTYLMLSIALYLGSLSLPADIKNRTIYTVVTKPVRPSEIILGRILGFTAACTVLLAVMGAAGYLFVIRAVSHSHTIEIEEGVAGPPNADFVGQTALASGLGHRHGVRVAANSFSPGVELAGGSAEALTVTRVTAAARKAGVNPGDTVTAIGGESVVGKDTLAAEKLLNGAAGTKVTLALSRDGATREATVTRLTAQTMTEVAQGHWHEVIARFGDDNQVHYEVGPAEGSLAARVPYYGTLKFRDRQGDPKNPGTWKYKKKGISVGRMFGYRSYIQGNSLAAAIWTFEGLTEKEFPDGLPLDLNIRVYRGEKGKVEEGITGSISLRNPVTGQRSKERFFKAKEYTLDRIDMPRKLEGPDGTLDIFKDLTSDGKIEVWLQCVEPGQSFGMARADVYVRGQDASFALNYFKAYVEIWLQVLLVTSLAVMFSTFLSGPVAVLVTITAIVMGFSSTFINNLTNSVIYREELAVIEMVRRVAGENYIDLEQEGVLRQAEKWKETGRLGAEEVKIDLLRRAFNSPQQRDPAIERLFQTQRELIKQIRQQAAADRIDLEAEGVARIAKAKRDESVIAFQRYDPARLDKALRIKADQVDVLDRVWGGGPCEAFYRLITQMNLTSELDPQKDRDAEPSRFTRVVHQIDNALMTFMQSLLQVLPDFRRFSDSEYLASGYNIEGSLVGQHTAATLGFSLAAFVAGFFALKYREVAA